MKTLLSIVLAVLALCSTGLAQKSVIRPPHPLRVFNGTGDGSYPFGHVQEISAPETLNGSNFFMWITIQGGYSIANPRSRTTTVRTLGHPMAVAAIYANAKVWYPDADEPPENQTEPSVGLFLPKKPVPEPSAMIFLPKKPGPERRQMMLKATLEMGELGMGHENRIFEYLGFGLDWFPQQEGIWHSDDVEFYDSPSGRTKLIRGQHLSLSGSNIPYITEPTPIYASRTDSPTSTSRISSTVSRNLSVWYEPKWTTPDMAPRTPGETPREAPKMYVVTPLESVFARGGRWHSYPTIKYVSSVLVPADIISNFNRDETIDLAGGKDRGNVTEQMPLRWWINDDSDNGDIASGDSDVPGALAGWFAWNGRDPNYKDTKVNGRCDLTDLFPLFLDLKQMIEVLPPSGSIQYKLKHQENGLGFIYTDLTPDQADDFCTDDATTGYGLNFAQPAKDASVTKITSAGVVLGAAFLNKIKGDGKGVLLFEVSKATTTPLILEVSKDGQKLTEVKFFIKTDSVEKMYRWINLRAVQGVGGSVVRPTNVGPPENYPDDLTNGKNFILVHGYSVREQQSRGWNAETFKRLHQLGSKAKYVAVTWRGDQGKLYDWVPAFGGATADYYENVKNAFLTSSHLATAVNSLAGEKYITGHSLGNMLTTSAIKDHSMSVNKYYMVDAAIAMEAFDASLESNQIMRDSMRHPDWKDYDTRLWSTEWYTLFDPGDGRRHKLTWRGRFGNIGNAINFYSSGEDVLQNNLTGLVPSLDANQGLLSWAKQEMEKGSLLIKLATWDSHGGWDFNSIWDKTIGYDPRSGAPIKQRRKPIDTDKLTKADLQADSFFKRFSDSRLYDARQGSAAANEDNVRTKMLAEALPALSFATGANALAPFNPLGGQNRNVDMMRLQNGWPQERLTNSNKGNRWLHSDFREIAFYFTQKLYKRFLIEGELNK